MALNAPPKIKGENELTAWLNGIWLFTLSSYLADVPASSTASGSKGQKAVDDAYLYICYDTNKWARIQYTDVVF